MVALPYFATLPDGVIRLAAKLFQSMAPILHTHAKNQVFIIYNLFIYQLIFEDLLNSMNCFCCCCFAAVGIVGQIIPWNYPLLMLGKTLDLL